MAEEVLECLGDQLPNRWWRSKAPCPCGGDHKIIQHERMAHRSNAAAARAHGVGVQNVSAAWSSWHGLPKLPVGYEAEISDPVEETKRPISPVTGQEPGLRIDFRRGSALLVTDPQDIRDNPELGDVDKLVRERGLDPEEWIVDRVKVNEWEGFYRNPVESDDGETGFVAEKVTLRQLVANLRRKPPLELIYPAVEVRKRAKPVKGSDKAVRLIACIGDQQADYHDEYLHQAFCRWLTDVQPTEIVLLGDTCDFPTISRHPDRPHWDSTPQQCVNVGYRLLSEYRDAVPDARMRKLRGNHDWRLESELLNRAERMFGLAPAENGDEQIPGYSIRRLLHLDALHIELVGREGDKWQLAEIEIAPGVYARHQPPNQKKHMRLNRDVIAGDTHRQSIRQVTVFNDDDEPVVRTLIEAGAMCRTDGIGFVEHPDWQPGFVTAAINEAGEASYELAVWRNGKLTWRGESWAPAISRRQRRAA